jgi:7,8-dihydropterin-6-yl-methyl-4-(beta-D-ribofuranosyl)aminobenzene 5'-phosphate synthase
MKITIIYDNTLYEHGGLIADWGFSALVEVPPEKKILFDTGTNGDILLNNMAVLGIVPSSIDEIFISHAHHDHVGGLKDFLSKNDQVKLWIPPSFSRFHQVKETVVVSEPREMSDGVYSTGELEGIEQSMVVNTKKGLVVIVGCSHPRMDNILGTASQFGDLYGIVGGLHGTQPKSLRGLSMICATHCTQHKSSIHALYPKAYQEGGVGRIIEIP